MRASERYTGDDGERYYSLASTKERETEAALKASRFSPYVKASDTVLDFGCGGGFMLARLPAKRRIGVEVNEATWADARARGIEVFASTSEVPEGSVDVVVSNHTLEHTLDPYGELVELHRALRDGGRLVLAVPIDDWRRPFNPAEVDTDQHLYTWTPRLLHHLLEHAGFRVERVEVLTDAWDHRFVRLPRFLWSLARHSASVVLRRRQVFAVGVKP
jgi:SAM-dependent methyltransferase